MTNEQVRFDWFITLSYLIVNWHVLTAEFKPVRILTDKHTEFHFRFQFKAFDLV